MALTPGARRLLAAGLAAWPVPLAAAPCRVGGGETVEIASIEPRLELRLTDGRMIRLAGLHPAQQTPEHPDLADATRAQMAALVVGKSATLHVLSRAPDRWGRLPASLFDDDDIAAKAIAGGLGRYLPEPAARACRDGLVAAEATARAGKLGLWADPYYAVLAVDDRAGFTERSGTFVLAEGRLAEVVPSPYRTTLRFAAPGSDSRFGHMLVATIPPRVMKTFEAQQVHVRALVGQRLRVRGLLDLRFGPQVELGSPDALEILPDAVSPDAVLPNQVLPSKVLPDAAPSAAN